MPRGGRRTIGATASGSRPCALLLAPREGCLLRFVAEGLAAEWPAPITVDVSVYASWYGAYMTQPPVHVTMSSNARGNQGSVGLEGLLHEGGHALLVPLDSALAATAVREGRVLPRELAHLMLFYTAGEAVRVLVPEHVTYTDAFGVWKQHECGALSRIARARVATTSRGSPHLR